MIKNPLANAGDIRDMGLIPGLGKSPGIGNGNSLQHFCTENPMDRGAWQATVHGIAKSQTALSTHTPTCQKKSELEPWQLQSSNVFWLFLQTGRLMGEPSGKGRFPSPWKSLTVII